MVSGVVLIAPLFATVTRIGAYNTLWSVILPVVALQVPSLAKVLQVT